MSDLTYEAIVAEINKTAQSKPLDNPYIYRYADIQVAVEVATRVERERIIVDLIDQFADVMECETDESLQIEQNSIYWSEKWQLSFNQLIALIKGENK